MNHFGPKIKKSEKPDGAQIIIHYPHSIPIENIDHTKNDIIKVASIDPARKNYALRIEKWDLINNTITPIIFDKFDFTDDEIESKNIIKYETIYTNMTNILNKYLDIFKECHYIICEKQPPLCYKTVRVSQHTISYFIEHLKDTINYPFIIEVDPKFRCKILNAPKKLAYDPLKEWMVQKAYEILQVRNDFISLQILNKNKKKDDLADTVCQSLAVLIHFGFNINVEKMNDDYTEFKGSNYTSPKQKKSSYISVRFKNNS